MAVTDVLAARSFYIKDSVLHEYTHFAEYIRDQAEGHICLQILRSKVP